MEEKPDLRIGDALSITCIAHASGHGPARYCSPRGQKRASGRGWLEDNSPAERIACHPSPSCSQVAPLPALRPSRKRHFVLAWVCLGFTSERKPRLASPLRVAGLRSERPSPHFPPQSPQRLPFYFPSIPQLPAISSRPPFSQRSPGGCSRGLPPQPPPAQLRRRSRWAPLAPLRNGRERARRARAPLQRRLPRGPAPR